MRLLIIHVFFIFSSVNYLYSQNDSIYNYHSPLEIPLILSANFGELRPNHFHMGIDFKTNGVEGQKLLAIENGYVSRIKVSPYGYGKVIYITHPNGITSVYAHCSVFLGKIDSIVRLNQELTKNFEIELFPSSTEIILKRGENFALSGNSGSSTAPHLHFELRDSKTETALNPLKYGFNIIDNISPSISGLKIYSLTERGYRIKGKTKGIAVQKGKFGYYVGGNLVTIPSDFCTASGGIGLSFEVIDHYSQATNPIGIYGSYLIVNNDTLFSHKLDCVSFEHTRYINSHIDYEENSLTKRKFQKSFKTKENKLTIYSKEQSGIITIQPKDSLIIKYIAYDTKNNKSELKFNLKVLPGSINTPLNVKNEDYLFPDKSFTYKSEKGEILITEGCFYEPSLKNLKTSNNISIGHSSTIIQTPIQIKLPLKDKKYGNEKYYIAVNNSYLATKYSNNWLSAESKSLGEYSIKIDTIAPSITPLNFLKTDTILKKKIIQWKLSESKTNISDYDIFIDGKWCLLEFESKGSYAFFRVTPDLIGKHTLKIIVKDVCGNEAIWEKEINFQL